MKKLLLSTMFALGTISMFAQEHDISQLVNQLLQQGNQEKPSSNNYKFDLENTKITKSGEDVLITASIKNEEGTFVYKNVNGKKTGFVLLQESDLGYLISENNNHIIATEVNKDEILISDPIHKHHDESHHRKNVDNSRRIPIGNNLTADALKLESRSGAPTVLLIDFDGEDVSGWGYNFYNVNHSNYSDDQIRKIWEVISADLIMFDINVTTNRALYDSYPVTKSLICVYGEATGLNKVGGLSLVNIFGTGRGCLVNSKNGDKGVETGHIGSHEVGHAMGLLHDGTIWPGPSVGYYGGHADWAPIMGNSYGKTYVTWSKGDYEFGGQKQDDLAIIGAHTGFAIDDQKEKSTLIIGKGDSLNWSNNNGIIENSEDVDTFCFEMATAGNINLKIGTTVLHTNLDVEVVIIDEQGNILFQQNETLTRNALVAANLQAGKYRLLIKSGHENTVDDGFTSYSSFGYYEITGTIEGLQKSSYDISVSAINGFNQRCGDFVEGSIVLKNTGSQTVTGGSVEVYLDGQLENTISISETMQANDQFTTAEIQMNNTGSHELKFKYIIDPIYQEDVTQNNEVIYNYFFENGDLAIVQSNLEEYNGVSPYSWNISSNVDPSALWVEGSTIDLSTDGNIISQSFCLTKECYSFNVVGDFNLCSQYPDYQNGAIYVGGSVVNYNGKIYEAKWWNQVDPTKGAWQEKGTCNSGSYSINLINESENTNITTVNSNNYSNQHNEEFCVDSIITTVSDELMNNIFVYPNPAVNWINVETQQPIGQLQIIDLHGRIVQELNTNKSTVQLNIETLNPGMYFINFVKGKQMIKFMK